VSRLFFNLKNGPVPNLGLEPTTHVITSQIFKIFPYFFLPLKEKYSKLLKAVLRIRIHRINMFLGLLDPDPLVTVVDPALDSDPYPSIIKQK
jgi:hypothetical protein